MNYRIAVIKGDGIGPEIVDEALKVLQKTGKRFGHSFEFTNVLMGGCAIDKTGVPLPDETVKICQSADSVLLGAVGGPKWDNLPGSLRPEAGLLGIRKALKLYANIRPAVLYPALKEACPLKEEISGGALDLVIVRELTGGIYFGARGHGEGTQGEEAYDTEKYNEYEISRIIKVAFEMARMRRKKLVSVDKANVLDTSRLWRKIAHSFAEQYTDVEYSDMLVDNAAMQLVKNPGQFDVIVTSNMFGDILSDEASMITGSIGMLPSASLNGDNAGLYEPSHGSAPDIAGQNIANPLATILSAAMMLKYSFRLAKEADAIENAVRDVLDSGYRTGDIMSAGCTKVTTSKMGDLVSERI